MCLVSFLIGGFLGILFYFLAINYLLLKDKHRQSNGDV